MLVRHCVWAIRHELDLIIIIIIIIIIIVHSLFSEVGKVYCKKVI